MLLIFQAITLNTLHGGDTLEIIVEKPLPTQQELVRIKTTNTILRDSFPLIPFQGFLLKSQRSQQ